MNPFKNYQDVVLNMGRAQTFRPAIMNTQTREVHSDKRGTSWGDIANSAGFQSIGNRLVKHEPEMSAKYGRPVYSSPHVGFIDHNGDFKSASNFPGLSDKHLIPESVVHWDKDGDVFHNYRDIGPHEIETTITTEPDGHHEASFSTDGSQHSREADVEPHHGKKIMHHVVNALDQHISDERPPSFGFEASDGDQDKRLKKQKAYRAIAHHIARKFNGKHVENGFHHMIYFPGHPLHEDGEAAAPAVGGGAPVNSMGSSSSAAGSGPIDGYDPMLRSKKMLKRRVGEQLGGIMSNFTRMDYNTADPEDQEAGTKDSPNM